MTTIVATPGAIYADSAVDDSGSVFKSIKIFRIRGKLVGCAGVSSLIGPFMDALRRGRKPECPIDIDEDEKNNFNALVVDPKGTIWHYDSHYEADVVGEPYMAIGTGGDAARAALICGKPPKEAIEIAAQIDSGTRGPVQVLYLGDRGTVKIL